MTATHSAFGLTLSSEIVLPWPAAEAADGARSVDIGLVSREELAGLWSGTSEGPIWDTTFPGGRRVTVERGHDGDRLFRHAERDFFRLSPGADRIDCAPSDPEEPSWRRFLLDTVLWWTALSRGLDILHAGAVVLGGGAVGIISASGGGKSTLVGELMRRGAPLFTDDVLVVGPAPDLVAHPGPPLMNIAAGRRELVALGRELARLDEGDDESWVAVDATAREPSPLRALVLYRRGAGLERAIRRIEPTVLDLVPHAWALPADPEGARRRFALLGQIADSVPVFELTAGATDSPPAIADVLSQAVGQ